jgi:hypothetical protein
MNDVDMWEAADAVDLGAILIHSDVLAAVVAEGLFTCRQPSPTRHGYPRAAYLCTRNAGHPGRHVTIGYTAVLAAWPGTSEPVISDLWDAS